MNELINFYQITSLIGTSGQPTVEQFKMIAESGYTIVINLSMHDSDNALIDEGNIVASFNMNYVHIPVPFESPLPSHLKDFFSVLDAFEGQKIFVHCALNARVSVFMHQYLTLKKEVNADDAQTPLLKKWLPKMDEKWKSILKLSIEEIDV